MYVYQNGRVTPEFLSGNSLPNLRSFLGHTLGDAAPRARSIKELTEKLPEDGILVDRQAVGPALKQTVLGAQGGFLHLLVFQGWPWHELDQQANVNRLTNLRNVTNMLNDIPTPSAIWVEAIGDGGGFHIVYVSEAEAEIEAPQHTREEEIDGKQMLMKAYELKPVPVIAVASLVEPFHYGTIAIRPIHAIPKWTNQLSAVFQWMTERLQLDFPRATLKAGAEAMLQAGALKSVNSRHEQDDSTIVNIRPCQAQMNAVSQQVETAVAASSLHDSQLSMNGIPFTIHPNAGVLSFGASTSMEVATGVVQAILGPA